LPKYNDPIPNTSIVEDEYVQELAQAGKAQVFITDTAAAALMCSTKAAYSWDLVMKKF